MENHYQSLNVDYITGIVEASRKKEVALIKLNQYKLYKTYAEISGILQ